MKNKKIALLAIGLIFIFMIAGCSRNEEMIDQISGNDHQEVLDPKDDDNYLEQLTPEELKDILLETVGIELRNTENQAIGLLKERDAILEFIEELFTYPKQEKLPGDSSEDSVVGPIHFYFNNNEDLYGLVKDDFIYLEGYYFLLTGNNGERVVNLFKNNIIKAPDSGN